MKLDTELIYSRAFDIQTRGIPFTRLYNNMHQVENMLNILINSYFNNIKNLRKVFLV